MQHTDYIGKQIVQNNDKGTIKYSGPLIHKINNSKINVNDHWLGIQWNSLSRGNHKGNVKDVQYFKCEPNTSGSLLKKSKVNFGCDILKAYIKKYFKEEDIKELLQNDNQDSLIESLNKIRKKMEQMKLEKQNIEYDEQAWIKTSLSYKRIEFLGFDRIWKILKNSHKIKHLSLDNLNISHLGKKGQVREMFSQVEELSLCDNLFNTWDILNYLIEEFPLLKNLQLSQNSLKFENKLNQEKEEFCKNFNYTFVKIPNFQFPNYFQNLEVVALTKLNINFEILNRVKYVFKNVKEIVLNHNRCSDFENLQLQDDDFKKLEILDLTNNMIQDIKQMKCWNTFKLKKLNLQNNQIQSIYYSDVLSQLTHLNIMDNNIAQKNILFDLSKLNTLQSIKYLNNPICQFYDKIVLKCFIISVMPQLVQINGSKLKFRERPDSEIFYLRNTFHEFFKEYKVDKYSYEFDQYKNWVQNQYPLTQQLLIKFGNPYPIEERYYQDLEVKNQAHQYYLNNQQQFIAKNYCLLKVIQKLDGEDCLILEKLIPMSTPIGFIQNYMSHILQKDIYKIQLNNFSNNQPFENLLKKIEDFAQEQIFNIKIKLLDQLIFYQYDFQYQYNGKRSLEPC